MTKLTESAIEDFAIKLFERLGHSNIHALDIANDGDNSKTLCHSVIQSNE